MLLSSLALAAALSVTDIERLSRYDAGWSNPRPEAVEEARTAFSGRALEIAEQFLHHSDVPPNFGAYAFVLSALGDVEATRTLIRAIPDPPKVESGILDRYHGEISALVEAILEKSNVGSDEDIVSAVVDALARARARPDFEPVAVETIPLLGKCRGPAALRALEDLAADSEPALRGAAADALGWLKSRGGGDQKSPVESLARILGSDPETDARRRAAESLGRLGLAAGIEPLRAALERDQDPRVVDAIVTSLERLGGPVTEPEQCRKLAERCWEAGVARPLFERWQATVDRRALVAAAVDAAPPLRALALRGLVNSTPAPPDLDAQTVARLVDSAIDLLDREVSLSTYGTALDALWILAEEKISTALPWADRISGRDAQYWASANLWFKDRAGYDSYRRFRETRAAVLLATLFLFLLWRAPRSRPIAAIALIASLGWGAMSFSVEGSLSLPPWPLPFSTIRFLVTLAVAFASGAAIRLPRLRALAAGASAALLFAVAYFLTRGIGFFPPDTQSGYAFIFDPITGLATAPPLAFLLTLAMSRWASGGPPPSASRIPT